MSVSSKIEIFTDGACSGNPGPGGWAAILKCGDHIKEIYGGEESTTNNRMELTAVIEGLRALKKDQRSVIIYTDSKYVMDGAELWLWNWKTRGWKTADKKPVKNEDLWRLLDVEINKHVVSWQWVRGHSGHIENERADFLARSAIPGRIKKSRKQ